MEKRSMTEDQMYRERYREALLKIKAIITPWKEHMETMREIYEILEEEGI